MNHFRLLPAQRLVVGQVEQDAGHKVTSGVLDQFLVVALYEQVAVGLGQWDHRTPWVGRTADNL